MVWFCFSFFAIFPGILWASWVPGNRVRLALARTPHHTTTVIATTTTHSTPQYHQQRYPAEPQGRHKVHCTWNGRGSAKQGVGAAALLKFVYICERRCFFGAGIDVWVYSASRSQIQPCSLGREWCVLIMTGVFLG